MRFLTITLAANGVQPFDVAGGYFEIIDSVGKVNVDFTDASGTAQSDNALVDALSGTFALGPFSRFVITERTGAAQTVTVMYGPRTGGTRRQPGIVQVVDTDKYTTESGAAFMGANSSGAPGAGNFGTVQLFNPVGNTKKAIIERVYIDVATATQACLGLMNATLGVASIFLASKLAGGAASTSRTYTFGANAADPAGTLAANQWSPNVAAGVQLAFTPKRPFILLPGYGLMVGARSANIGITVTFEFWEQNLQ